MAKIDSKKLKSMLGSYGIIFVLILLVAVFAALSLASCFRTTSSTSCARCPSWASSRWA